MIVLPLSLPILAILSGATVLCLGIAASKQPRKAPLGLAFTVKNAPKVSSLNKHKWVLIGNKDGTIRLISFDGNVTYSMNQEYWDRLSIVPIRNKTTKKGSGWKSSYTEKVIKIDNEGVVTEDICRDRTRWTWEKWVAQVVTQRKKRAIGWQISW